LVEGFNAEFWIPEDRGLHRTIEDTERWTRLYVFAEADVQYKLRILAAAGSEELVGVQSGITPKIELSNVMKSHVSHLFCPISTGVDMLPILESILSIGKYMYM
jgi:hypothetical protein